jgi:hypothetical protein
MGLDMTAYTKVKGAEETTEIQYWRKHNALHGLMEEIWRDRAELAGEDVSDVQFNCVEVPLNEADIDYIESQVRANELPETQGFFFGGDSRFDEHNKEGDLEFIAKAREALARGEEVYYNSWW